LTSAKGISEKDRRISEKTLDSPIVRKDHKFSEVTHRISEKTKRISEVTKSLSEKTESDQIGKIKLGLSNKQQLN
jgi:hypothetical protein